MIRVHVICEGQTEETFIKEVLAPHFGAKDVILCPALIGKPGHKGGAVSRNRILTDCRIRLRGDPAAYCTTLIDFYGLPEEFPGKLRARGLTRAMDKAACVASELTQVITGEVGAEPARRFIPYVQMYEFEALLFSDPAKLATGIAKPNLGPRFQQIRSGFGSPEEINDSPHTAPSKRILTLVPGYEKPIMGTLAALEIGLETMRAQCGLFNGWIEQLEALA